MPQEFRRASDAAIPLRRKFLCRFRGRELAVGGPSVVATGAEHVMMIVDPELETVYVNPISLTYGTSDTHAVKAPHA